MCGIIAAASHRNVTNILLGGLERLEYRGYDSAGVALVDGDGQLQVRKLRGKVQTLKDSLAGEPLAGCIGIGHTRWATHGAPDDVNAHPHRSGDIALVHNGIIENHEELRAQLQKDGYEFHSATDTEVVVHLLHRHCEEGASLRAALRATVALLQGSFALAAVRASEPHLLVAARRGSPLVLGLGVDELFVASDGIALGQVTDRLVYLEEGDMLECTADSWTIRDQADKPVERPVEQAPAFEAALHKGKYRHYMEKEIFEQPQILRDSISARLGQKHILEESFGVDAREHFAKVRAVHIVACGSSYYAALVARYWLEDWADLPCQVEIASEYRYRRAFVPEGCIFVAISQSGETADTLAAMDKALQAGYSHSLSICNVASSSLVRRSELSLMTLAGSEIGVVATKSFTSQLLALQFFAIAMGRHRSLGDAREAELVAALHQLPMAVEQVLASAPRIQEMMVPLAGRHHALFLGRGVHYPVACEGALKLKEVSYIHAEAYAAGELKHGPLALVDEDMPVVAVAPNDDLLDKLKANLQEIRARQGRLYVLADESAEIRSSEGIEVLNMPSVPPSIAPITYTVALQLLAYYIALARGTNVDQPRNLAKSVTVE